MANNTPTQMDASEPGSQLQDSRNTQRRRRPAKNPKTQSAAHEDNQADNASASEVSRADNSSNTNSETFSSHFHTEEITVMPRYKRGGFFDATKPSASQDQILDKRVNINDNSENDNDGDDAEEGTTNENLMLMEEEIQKKLAADNEAMLRAEALQKLKSLESLFINLSSRIIDEKLRDLDELEESVKSCKHDAVETDQKRTLAAYENALHACKRRREYSENLAETELQATLKSIEDGFDARKSELRTEMILDRKRKILALQSENEQFNERSKLGRKIQLLESVLTSPFAKQKAWRSYPILQQFNWQRRENIQVLAAYCSREDEFGSFIPPQLKPFGLHSKEIESDLDLIKKELKDDCKENIKTPLVNTTVQTSTKNITNNIKA
ncbi:hypothetical protein MP638_006253 [Amoeboaphelidium occidentale]|nr:hypothetical protein MP638_006253 [Amoeboaphelidium occidentale]